MKPKKLILLTFCLWGLMIPAQAAPLKAGKSENFSLFNPLAGIKKWPSLSPVEMQIIARRLTNPEVQSLSDEQLNLFPKKALPVLETKMSEAQLDSRGLLLSRQFVVDGQIRQVTGRRHHLGGGFVALTASVGTSVYVGPEAAVLDQAQAHGYAWIWDKAILYGQATVKDHVQMKGQALVGGQATLSDYAVVEGKAHIKGYAVLRDYGKAGGRAVVKGHAQIKEHGRVAGQALFRGEAQVGGYARVAGHVVMEQQAQASGQLQLRGKGSFGGEAILWGNNFTDNPEAPFYQQTFKLPLDRQPLRYGKSKPFHLRTRCATVFKALFGT